MFIVIENEGHSEAWLVDTADACAEASARLRELGIESAEVWTGDLDGDTVLTGTRIFAE